MPSRGLNKNNQIKTDNKSNSIPYNNTHKNKNLILLSKTKRSQSALEYMMTYGWAILIIVIVAVILYSMGIFNPSASVSYSITGFSGLIISSENCVAGGTLIITVGNALGYQIELYNVTAYFSNGSSITEPLDYSLSPSALHNFYLQMACPTTVGSYFTDKLRLTGVEYTSIINTPLNITGSISGKISSLIPYQVLEVINTQSFPTVSAISENGYYIWQPNQDNSTISIINVVSSSVVKTLTGLPARSVIFSNNGKLAFIAGNSKQSAPYGTWMIVMNTSNYAIIKNISGLSAPPILSLSPNGQELFLPGYFTIQGLKETRLIIINTSSLQVIANVSEGGFGAWSAEETPNYKYIYLTVPSNNSVVIMNATTLSIIKNMTGFTSPKPIVFSLNSTYAYVGGDDYLTEINTNTESIVYNKSITNTPAISAFAYPPSLNTMYIPICGSNIIPVFDTLTNSVVANITVSQAATDTCMSYSVLAKRNNFLYVATATQNELFVISI